jgi:ribosomal RNA-processing protein 8
LFLQYHTGFKQQVQKWPINPIAVLIEWLLKLKQQNLIVADFGCGEAKLAQTKLPNVKTVHSFDLQAINKFVTACDISHVTFSYEFLKILKIPFLMQI